LIFGARQDFFIIPHGKAWEQEGKKMKKRNFGKAVKTALVSVAAGVCVKQTAQRFVANSISKRVALAALVMAALVFSGCEQSTGGSGKKANLSLEILSIEEAVQRNINKPPVSASVIGISRTVHPVFESSYWDKYVLSFANTGGGSNPSDITVNKGDSAISGNIITVRATLGTYNVTVTAYKDDVAVAKGTAEITVQEGTSSPEPVIMGPNTDGSLPNGKLTWEIDLTGVSALESGVFYITDIENNARVDINGATAGTDIALTAGTNNKDEAGLEIAPGVYRAYIKLEKGGQTAPATLPGEIVYIYAGQTSALPKQTFTEGHFSVTVKAVTLLDLSGKVTVPVTGQAVGSNSISTEQYSGTIEWLTGGNAFNGATFAGETVYTAKVTLTTLPGWTFTGAGNFTYSGGSATAGDGENGARTVTIVFAATDAVPVVQGDVKGSLAYPNEVIAVSNYPDGGLTLASNGSAVTLSVSGYTEVAWRYGDATSSGNGFELNPSSYPAPIAFSIVVEGKKNGQPRSRTLQVAITKVDSGNGQTPNVFQISEIKEWLTAQPNNTADTAYTITLAAGALVTGTKTYATDYTDLYKALVGDSVSGMAGTFPNTNKYVVLDLSLTNWSEVKGHSSPTKDKFNFLYRAHAPKIVGVILPENRSSLNIYCVFYGMIDMKWVEIPESTTISNWGSAFGTLSPTESGATTAIGSTITKIIMKGGLTSAATQNAWGTDKYGFHTFFDSQTNKTGIYELKLINDEYVWTKTDL
jgi:hypothetical protein